MGTLMTVFSGMAALLCLLVGLQLFVLEAQIGQADNNHIPDSRLQFRHWQAQAHTGAVMSLGAGVLIFLFGLRNHTSTVQAEKKPSRLGDSSQTTIDPDALSIRVFESDTADRYVEISPGTKDPEWPERPAAPPRPPLQAPQAVSNLDTDLEPEADPTDSIVQSIREAVAPENGRISPACSGPWRPSFFGRLFRSRRRG